MVSSAEHQIEITNISEARDSNSIKDYQMTGGGYL